MDNLAYLASSDEIFMSDMKSQDQIDNERIYQFEEAVDLTNTGVFHYYLMFICGCCIMAVTTESSGVSNILPYMICDINSTIAEQSILTSSSFLGMVLGSYPISALADTWSRIRTLRASLLLTCASTVISTFSINIWMLIVARFFSGVFISGFQSCTFSFMSEFHGNGTRIKYVTLLSIFFCIAPIIMSILALVILPIELNLMVFGIKFSSWRLLLLSNSLPTLIGLFGLLGLPESPKQSLIHGRCEEALKTLRMVFKLNTWRPESDYPIKKVFIETHGISLDSVHNIWHGIKLIRSQTAELFQKNRAPHVINICLMMIAFNMPSQSISIWLPTILDQMSIRRDQRYALCEVMAISGGYAANSSSVSIDTCNGFVNIEMFGTVLIISIAVLVTYILLLVTMNYLGKKSSIVGWTLLSGTCCLTIHWSSSYVWSSAMLTLALVSSNCTSIIVAICVEYFPMNINVMAVNLGLTVGCIGAVVGNGFFGIALYTNCHTLFYSLTGVILAPVILSFFLPNITKAP